MAKVKKTLEKSSKTNVINTAEKKNSPKNRVKSVIKKAKQDKTVDVDKAKNIVKNLVKAKDLQKQIEQAPKKIQEKTKKNKKTPPPSPEKKKVQSPEKKKPVEVTVDSPKKVVKSPTSIALDSKTVESAVDSLFHLLENDDKVKLFDDQEERFMLQVKSIKVPEANPMIKRITLKHGKLNANSDICFIVNDYKKPKDVDKTIEFYEKIFEMHNITNIKCIMPFYTVSTEYAEYENQRRLVELYDSFLIDASIASKFSTIFRAVFIKKSKMPRMIRMRATNLKDQVEKSLKMVPMKISDGRDSYLVEFGHHLMNKQEIVENLNHVVQELNNVFPGGHNNIRNMYVKTPTGVAVPLYLSLANSSDVETPVVKRKLPKAFRDVRGELSTFTDAEVIVKPYGDVILVRNKKVQSLGDDEDIEEEDIEDEAPNKIRKVEVEDVAVPVEKKKKGKGKNKRELEAVADEIMEPKVKQAKKVNEEVKSTEVTSQEPKGKGKIVKQSAEVTPDIVKPEIEEKPKGKGKKNKKSNEEAIQKVIEVITEKPKGKGNKNVKPIEETVESKIEVTAEKPKGKGKNVKPNVETVETKKEVTTEKTKGKGKNNLKPSVETKIEVVAEKTKGKGKNNAKPIEVAVEAKTEEVTQKSKGKKNAKPIEEPVEVKSEVAIERPKGKKNKGPKEEVAKVESNENVVRKKQKGKGKDIKPTEEIVASPKAPIVQKPKAKKTKVVTESVPEEATNQPKKNNKRKLVENKPDQAVPAVANNKNAAKKGKNSDKEAAVLAKSGSEKVKPAVDGAQKKMNSPSGKNKKKKKNVA